MNRKIFTKLLLCLFLTTPIVNPIQAEWQAQNSPVSDYLYDAFCLNNQTAYATGWGVSAGAVMLKTTDGGENWNYSIPLNRSLLFKVTFLDSDLGFACGYDGVSSSALLLMTVDGGESWNPQTFRQSFGFYVVQFPSASVGYVCGYNGAIFKTSDGGNQWRLQQTGTNNVFRLMHFVDEDRGWAVAGTSFNNPSMIYRTTDGGAHWAMVHNFSGAFVVGGIVFSNDSAGIAVGSDGNEAIYRTTDGGENWERIYSTNSRMVLQDVTLTGEVGYAVGDGGRIHITTNGGETWAADTLLEGSPLLLSVDNRDGFTFAVGEGGMIIKRNEPEKVTQPEASFPPGSIGIISNYPNPFNSTTILRFEVSIPGSVDLQLIDMTGRLVWTRAAGNYPAGQYQVPIQLSDSPSGVYRLQINAGSIVRSHTIQLLR